MAMLSKDNQMMLFMPCACVGWGGRGGCKTAAQQSVCHCRHVYEVAKIQNYREWERGCTLQFTQIHCIFVTRIWTLTLFLWLQCSLSLAKQSDVINAWKLQNIALLSLGDACVANRKYNKILAYYLRKFVSYHKASGSLFIGY